MLADAAESSSSSLPNTRLDDGDAPATNTTSRIAAADDAAARASLMLARLLAPRGAAGGRPSGVRAWRFPRAGKTYRFRSSALQVSPVPSPGVALLVQKFGGTSVADAERIRAVADHVARTHTRATTSSSSSAPWARRPTSSSRLARRSRAPARAARWTCSSPPASARAMALLCMALADARRRGRVVHRQPGRLHHRHHPHATPRSSRSAPTASAHALAAGQVPVVGGLPGRVDRRATSPSSAGAAPTPPRWRSPAALGADVCELYTDVSGVFTADPRVVPERPQDGPRLVRRAARDDGDRLPEAGDALGRVRPQPRRAAARPLGLHLGAGHAGSTEEDADMEAGDHLGVTHDTDEAKVTVTGVPDRPGIAGAAVPGRWPTHDVNVDMIVQNTSTARRHRHLLHRAARRPRRRPMAIVRAGVAEIGASGVEPRRRHRPGQRRRRRHEDEPGRRRHDVRDPGQRRHQHRDDLDLGHPHQLRGRRGRRSSRRCRRCTPRSGWPRADARRLTAEYCGVGSLGGAAGSLCAHACGRSSAPPARSAA